MYCSLHVQKGSHRKFSRAALTKATNSAPTDANDGLTCSGCSRSFRSKAGLVSHRRSCKAVPPDSSQEAPSLDPLLRLHGVLSKEGKVYKRKLSHWVLLRKNRELRNGTHANKCYPGKDDIQLKHRLKKAASTIISCLQGDHTLCRLFSFVCKDGIDPYLYLLPHARPICPLPDGVKSFLMESVNDVFSSAKLDRLLYRGNLSTTSVAESVHRTIRSAAPKVNE